MKVWIMTLDDIKRQETTFKYVFRHSDFEGVNCWCRLDGKAEARIPGMQSKAPTEKETTQKQNNFINQKKSNIMANINSGILGGFSGKVGTVVGYISRGKAFMRHYVKNVQNPRTRKQQTQRTRFGVIVALASEFLPAVKLGLHKMAQSARNSEANSFMHLNFDSVSASNPFDVEVSYADLKIADGKLPEVSFAAPSFEETNSIQCAFIGNVEAEGADSSDSVYLFAYSPELGKGLLSAPVSRSEQSITLNTPLGWNGTTVHVYGFTVNGTGVASDSCYVGSGSIN